MNTKVCLCGRRGKCLDSRLTDVVRRRYKCPKCKKRWSTIEYRIDGDDSTGHNLEDVFSDQMAKKLHAVTEKQHNLILEFLKSFRGFGKKR